MGKNDLLDDVAYDSTGSRSGKVIRIKLHQAQKRRGVNSRLCGDLPMLTRYVDYLSMLTRHVDSVKTGLKHKRMYTVCGENKCYAECGLCNIPLLYVSNRGRLCRKAVFLSVA